MKNQLLVCLVLLGTTLLSAQPDSTIYDLDAIVIRENRLEIPFRETSRSIQVITASQIAQMPVRSVNELLQHVAGVDVRQRGAHGIQADVSIRGGTFEQTLVLINGIRLTDPQTGHHNMNLPLDLENIARIEVLKGPGARIYGQNAFAGAINIVTKKATENSLSLSARAGENGLGGGSLALSLQPNEESNHYLSVARDFSNGYRYNTDYDISSYFYQYQREMGQHQLSLTAGHSDRAFGANGFYASPDFKDQYEEVATTFVALQDEYRRNRWRITPRVFWRKNKDHYIFVRDNPSLYQNIHTGHTLGAELQSHYASRFGDTGLGVEAGYVSLNSTNLGERRRRTASLFLEHRFRWKDKLDVTPGISMSSFSDFGTRFFPGIDVGVNVSEQVKLFANAGYTYRVPTFTDLYYSDPANNGNPDLQPEEALSYEIGSRFLNHNGGLHLQLALFQRNGFDLIDWTRAADTLRWTPVNINELVTQGAEVSLSVLLPLLLSTETPLERLTLSYTRIHAQLEDNEAPLSRYVLENLDHQLIAGFSYRWGQRWLHSIHYRYTSRVSYPTTTWRIADSSWQQNRWSLFIEATNLTNTRYTETNLVTMPGRWMRIGGQFRMVLSGG
ncbi:MAG: TonB-dependent receptor [Saprospiraceae bacterium]